MRLTPDDIEAAVLGGAVLGGGGGGSMENGRWLGHLAMEHGGPELVSIENLPDKAMLVTCSYVGSPAARNICVRPEAYLRSVEMIHNHTNIKLGGLITNECGGTATLNGWFQAAALGLPLVDAPCNGRAHPTGLMGSMGLHSLAGYVSHQAASGGDQAGGRYIEMYVKGSIESTSTLIRQAAVQAGGMVAVARNPVSVAYVRNHSAKGAIWKCIELGRIMLTEKPFGGMAMARAAAEYLGGEIITTGTVSSCILKSKGGFDIGEVTIGDYRLDFWNEYMTLEWSMVNKPASHSGHRPNWQTGLVTRLATFPDLIVTLRENDGVPVTTAEVQEGQRLVILRVPRENLILGAGMFSRDLYVPAEEILGKKIWSPVGVRSKN